MPSHQNNGATAVLTVPTETIVNGVNVTALFQTIEAVQANPLIAKFRFNAKNNWLGGPHTRSSVNQFHGAMQDMERSRSFLLHADEPAILLGHDHGPNPGEYLLHALAACVTSTLVYHAAARGIVIEEVKSKIEGDVDVRGFLGLDKSVRNGFGNIRMTFEIRADLTDQELQDLVALGPTFSPVYDSLTKGVPITIEAQRMKE